MTSNEGNPQKEVGFTPIQNDVLEAMARTRLSDYESRCIHLLWRKTYGWADKKGHRKQFDTISRSQWEAGTGILRRHTDRVLNRLVARSIITRKDKKIGNQHLVEWGFVKEYGKWLLPKQDKASKQVSVTNIGDTPSHEQMIVLSPTEVHTKERKENIQKKATTKKKGDKEENSKVTELKPSLVENELLQVFKSMLGWQFDEKDDLKWLRSLLQENGNSILSPKLLKACRDYHSEKPASKGPWKNRIRKWLDHESKFKQKKPVYTKKLEYHPQSLPTTEELKKSWLK